MLAFRMTDCGSSLPGRSPAWQRPGVTLPAPVPPRSPRRREGRGMAGPGRCQDSLPSVADRYPRLRGFRESTLVSPLSARSIPAPLGTRRRLRSPGSSVPLVRGVARWSVPDARPRGQLPGAPPPVLLPPAGWARLLPRKSPAWGTPVLRVL